MVEDVGCTHSDCAFREQVGSVGPLELPWLFRAGAEIPKLIFPRGALNLAVDFRHVPNRAAEKSEVSGFVTCGVSAPVRDDITREGALHPPKLPEQEMSA